jgi:hypothetical protein
LFLGAGKLPRMVPESAFRGSNPPSWALGSGLWV